MKRFLTLLGVVGVGSLSGMAAGAATQQTVLGASSDPVFSVRVQGSDNVIYKCRPDIIDRADGTRIRECIPEDDDVAATVFDSGMGIAGAGPAAAGVLVALVVLSTGGDSDDDTATATTDAD